MPINPFKTLLNDKVTLVKKDGRLARKDIAASVQPNKIITYDADLPIEVGDHFLRNLPNGLVDEFIVDDPGYSPGLLTIPPHFTSKVHRSDQPAGQPQTIINNIVGDHAKVNVNSTDNSTNTVTTNSATLFTEMLKAVSQIATKSERETIAATISAMSAAQERQDRTFLSKYQDFMSAAANHMTIFAPFLPALSKLIGS
jgi:hypothetical protein